MKRLLKIAVPVIILAIFFCSVYFASQLEIALPANVEIRNALLLLQDYGYESRQIVGVTNSVRLIICFTGFAATCILYFYFYERSEQNKIQKVIDYVRKINRRIYDLRLDENSEDNLSLLTNELYKTTILLQEAAENDRKRAKNMEDALADISHQLRTPLTTLQIMLDNLYDHPNLDLATRQDFLRTAARQIEQMSELIVTLLNLAKFDNGSLKMKPKVVAVSDLLKDVAGRLGVLAELNNVSVKMTGDLNTKLKVDPKWQSEALLNIVKNCIEHSRPGQTVSITVQETAVFTRITISDSGDGISPEDVRHIFERFYKAKNTLSESVGIGLSFSKAIIEAGSGQVRVKSRISEGTKFIVNYYRK